MASLRLHQQRWIAPTLLIGSALVMLAAVVAVYLAVSGPSASSADSPMIHPAPQAETATFKFKPGIEPETAARMNASVPDSDEPLVSARPFSVNGPAVASGTRLSAVDCLTAAVYYEAASETLTGQRAVAQVVLNRVRHPSYPNSVCGVVFQGSQRKTGCQFTFTCDGSLNRRPSAAGWTRARAVAAQALAGYVEPSVGLATHYHTQWVVPYWSDNLTKLRTVGAHIFYRWNGSAGTRSAFSGAYANAETIPASAATRLSGFLLGTAALAVDDAATLQAADAAETVPVNAAVQGSRLISRSGGELSASPASALRTQESQLEKREYRLESDGQGHRLLEDRNMLRDAR